MFKYSTPCREPCVRRSVVSYSSASTPANQLARLQRQAATEDGWVVAWERASGPTAERLDISLAEVERYVLATVRALALADFVERVMMRGRLFDVYACYRDGLGWYVKVGEDDDGLLVISHHQPERGALTTVSGRIVSLEDPRGTVVYKRRVKR